MKFITRNLRKSWSTYLPDETKPNNRQSIKRKSKEDLEKSSESLIPLRDSYPFICLSV